MKCLQKSEITKWVDGEMAKNPAILGHINSCAVCQAELISAQRVRDFLKTASPAIGLSDSFESGFWSKVNASAEESWSRKFWASLEELIPRMTLAPALTVLVAAMLVGGAAGFGAGLDSFENQGAGPMSGSADYKGLPAGSVAAAYLQAMERTA